MGDEAGCDAIYKFGQFCLDAGGSTLTKRGKKVRLNARPMEVLLALVERPRQLVTKKDLVKRVWGHLPVGQNNLDQQISVLRKALGGGRDKYIINVPREGYKFVVPVKTVDRIENAGPAAMVAPVEVVAPVVTVAPVEQGQGEVIAPAKIVATIEQVPNKVIEGEENATPGVYDKDGNLVIGAAEYEAIMEEASHYPESLINKPLNGNHESQVEELPDEALEREADEAASAWDAKEQRLLRDAVEDAERDDVDKGDDHENFYYDPDCLFR